MSSVETALTPVSRPGLPSNFWNWRWEACFVVIVAAASAAIAATSGIAVLIAVIGAGLAAVTGLLFWSPARKRMKARLWCVITPHRVRAGCEQAWVQNRRGKLPIVIWTSPAEFGERLLLWCPAGITASDVAAAREVIAAACWAADARVLPHQHHSHLVRLEIVRNFAEKVVLSPPPWPDSEDGPREFPDPEDDRWRGKEEPARYV